MLRVGAAQTRNSTDLEANYSSISSFLDRFERKKADLVLFPECSLSGFSAKISECSLETLNPFLYLVDQWSKRTGIHVVLPTAIAEHKKVYNSGFWFGGGETALTPNVIQGRW
jgi:predicted amidohydrolase